MTIFQPMIAAIELVSQEWTWPVVGVIAVVFVLLLLTYRTTSQSLALRTLLVGLKITGVVLIALCLLNPALVQSQIRPGENIIVMLTDNSASMTIRSADQPSRAEQIVELHERDRGEWLTRLTQDFDLRRYQFAEQLSQIDNIAELDFSGSRSQLAASLESITQRFRNQPLAAVLVLTDGNANDAANLAELKLPVPIYPIVDESWSTAPFDISIDQLSVTESPFEDAPITIAATISSTSEKEMTANVVLELNQDKPEEDETSNADVADITPSTTQKKLAILRKGESTVVHFQLKPEHRGIAFYRLRVTAEDEPDAFKQDFKSREATLANNQRLISVSRGDDDKRILYVGGRPNWEYKFFNRALQEDQEVQLVSLIRIARKEAKFDFRGRVGENSNSLFRGQEREADEETESYDQAVLIRLNTRDAQELSGGFPKSKKELYEYNAIILDDIEAKFFTPDQQALLDRFVAERGGGLLMLGGRDSFRHGQWQKSPLRDVLPIYIDRGGENPSGNLTWNLTRDGWLEPWMRVRSTEEEEQARLLDVPPVQILNSLPETKPGSRVFANVIDEQGAEFPAVIAHQYGRGRAAAVLVGDLWRWSLSREENEKDDLAQNWRQTIRWLTSEVPQRVETELIWETINSTLAAMIQVRLRDEEYQAKENAVVTIAITPPDGEVIELNAEPSLEEPGLFEATYLPRDEGAYLAQVQVTDETELAPQTATIGWTSQPNADEFQQIAMNEAVLSALATQTDGEVVRIDDLPEFVKTLPQKEMPVKEIKTTPLWHSPWILLVALSCFAAEWGLRRWRGLP